MNLPQAAMDNPTSNMELTETHPMALRFGPVGRQCAGLYRPARTSDPALTRVPVLLCQPFGQEAIRAQRLFRALGDRLAAQGHPVLRFDHYGTGDADGSDTDGNLEHWAADIAMAHEELKRLSGQSNAVWIGLRLGATLAALASKLVNPPPSKIIMWGPVHDGPDYLRELLEGTDRNLQASLAQRWHVLKPRMLREHGEGPVQASGFELGTALLSDIKALNAKAFQGAKARQLTLLQPRQESDPHPVATAMLGAGLLCKSIMAADDIDWSSDEAMGTAIVPAGVMSQLLAEMASVRT